MFKRGFITICILFLVGIVQVEAEQVLMTRDSLGSELRNNTNGTVGLSFITGSEPVFVDQLGMIDINEDGLATAHRVGIWDSSGNLVAQATVPSGTEGVLSDGFRYAPVDSGYVMLQANTEYKLGAEVFSGGDYWPNAANVNLNEYYVGTDSYWECRWGNGYGDPAGAPTWGDYMSYGGPNMRTVGDYSTMLWCYWNLNETTGTKSNDLSGNQRLGILNGELTFDNDSVTGKEGSALSLDGSDDFISYGFVDQYWDRYTVSLWVKSTEAFQSQYSGVFNSHHRTDGGFQIDLDGNNPQNYRYISSTGSITMGQTSTDWVHLAVVFDGTETSVYYNGSFVGSAVLDDAVFNQICLGRNRAGSVYFEGAVDDVQIYAKALDNSEINFLYNNPGTIYSEFPTIFAPYPDQHSWDVPIEHYLEWSVAGVTEFTPKFDVYLGSDPGNMNQLSDNQSELTCEWTNQLASGIDYFWRVDIVDDSTTPETVYQGRIWDFITLAPLLEIVHWPLDNDYLQSGDYYTPDTTDFSYDGMMVNFSDGSWTPGVDGNCLEFAGNNDYVIHENVDNLPIGENDSWTVNFYIKPLPESTPWTLISSLGEKGQRAIYLMEDNKIGLLYQQEYILVPPVSLYPDKWNMVTVSESPGEINIYYNGELKLSRTLPLTDNDNMGEYSTLPYYTNKSTFKGYIDDFKVYRGGISQEDIDAFKASMPSFGDVDNSGRVDFNDMQVIAEDWFIHNLFMPDVKVLDDMETYDQVTFDQHWSGRKDLPGDNELSLITSGAYSGNKAVQWVYDFKDGRRIGTDVELPGSGSDLRNYDELRLWVYKSSGSTGGTFWCKLVNEDWPLAGDRWEMAQSWYEGGLDAIPEEQWVEWVIDLDQLNAPTLPGRLIPSDRITNLTSLSFGGYSDTGGSGIIYIDGVRLCQKENPCSPEFHTTADINGDCRVDIEDISIFALDWLEIK